MTLLLAIELIKTEHMVDDFFGSRNVPHRQHTFATVANSGCEHGVALNCELDGLELRSGVLEKGDGEWRFHDDLRRGGSGRGGG